MVLRPVFVGQERGRGQHHRGAGDDRGEHGHGSSGERSGQHLDRSCERRLVGLLLRVFGVGVFGVRVELDVSGLLRIVGGLVALVMSGCATAQIFLPPEQASHVDRRLTSETRFLATSMYVTPLFGDSTKKFLTAVEPKLVRVLNNPDGSSVNPGKVEGILPVGTAVRVDRVEFPSTTVMAERVLFTPRTLAWLYLDVANTKKAVPHVLVLRPGLRTEDELMSEVERYLSREDPAKRLESFSDATREGVKTKTAVLDMPSEALEMTWGPPERKNIALEGDKKRETWFWGETRNAVLLDGRVVDLNP